MPEINPGDRVALKAGPTWRGRVGALGTDDRVVVKWDDGQVSGCRASALMLESDVDELWWIEAQERMADRVEHDEATA